MKLAELVIRFEGDDDTFTPEFEAALERFEERLEIMVENADQDFGPDVRVRVSDH